VPRHQRRQNSNCHSNVALGCSSERGSRTSGQDGQHIERSLGPPESLQRPTAAEALLRVLQEKQKITQTCKTKEFEKKIH